MSVDEINKGFNKWNPMETDYRNTEFNQYVSGPGADLDEELQPARQALQNRNEKTAVPTLVFKQVPKEMTKNALNNICSRHGRVREVRDSKKNEYYFVDMATVADMEAVFRGLENNNYGFKIMVGKEKEKQPFNMKQTQSQLNGPTIPPRNTGIDYESRTYPTSKRNHPRPKIWEDSPFNASNIANTGLPINLLTNDAHSLERQGLNNLASNNKFSYRNGRAFVKMPEKTKQFVDKKHKESSGRYIENGDKYLHISKGIDKPNNIMKCSQCYYVCDTVCERCSQYYCSIECQKSDWPEHRYKCGKPKHLQKTPPSKKENGAENNSSGILKEQNNKATDFESLKEITIKGISPEEFLGYSKTITTQLQTVCKKSSTQNITSSNTLCQLSNSQKITSQVLQNPSKRPSHHSPISSKPSSKKLPAALRMFSQQYSNNSEESTQRPTNSLQSFSQKLSDSTPSSSQNNLKKSPENSVEEYKRNMPRSGNIVTITAISKTNVVFVRSTTYEANLSYTNTVDTLQTLGKVLHPLKTIPKSGDVIVAKFEEQYNRALVLSVLSPTKILIHFMDYGNIEQAKFEDLLEAPEEFVFKPRHAIPVLLKDVADVYMTQEIRKFMHIYLNNINVEIRYKLEDFREDNNVYAVQLIDETTQQNLNKMIMKLSKPVEPQNTDEICDRDYLEKKILPGGKNVEFIVMDNSLMCSGFISGTTKPYAIEIEKFTKDIQAYVKSIPDEPYTPRVNELCIAQYDEDGLWYRGVCLETVGDGHPTIHFLDYGNITLVPIESIRRYPRQFTYPVYTADCAIEGLPEFCDDKIVEKLEDLIPNGELIKCENVIVDEENHFYILSMPNVIKELTKLGLLKI